MSRAVHSEKAQSASEIIKPMADYGAELLRRQLIGTFYPFHPRASIPRSHVSAVSIASIAPRTGQSCRGTRPMASPSGSRTTITFTSGR